MNKLSLYFLYFFTILVIAFVVELTYLNIVSNHHEAKKSKFISLVGLPDLSISNGANFIRHRSYSDTFSIFSNGPELLEYFPSTFTYSYSSNQKNNPSRIELDQ